MYKPFLIKKSKVKKKIEHKYNRKWQSEEEVHYVQALRYVPSSEKSVCMYVKEIGTKVRERQTYRKEQTSM